MGRIRRVLQGSTAPAVCLISLSFMLGCGDPEALPAVADATPTVAPDARVMDAQPPIDAAPAVPDTAPTWPVDSQLRLTPADADLRLLWTPAYDDLAVTAYRITRDGTVYEGDDAIWDTGCDLELC